MSAIRILIDGTSDRSLPALGHGLWVDNLTDVEATEALARQMGGAHLDLLVDLRVPGSHERLLAALAICKRIATQAWLLAIVRDEAALEDLQRLAATLDVAACRPQGILATPAAYLESHQPDGPWPAGPSPGAVAALASRCLPGYLIGGGVPTYFTELNRCRPTPGGFDYLTHATSPTVHAADDLSVMESLESLGDIVRSARALAHGRPYRLTTTAIGAWRNPYGGHLTPNPRHECLTLSDQDPRQNSQFAAAWTLGHYAAVQRAGVDAVALWAVNQPFAMARAGEYWPVFHVLRGLNLGNGKTALRVSACSPDIAVLAWRDGAYAQVWVANLTAVEQRVELPEAWVLGVNVLDGQSCSAALHDPDLIHRRFAPDAMLPALAPYAVLVVDCRYDVESGL
jgi:hypothetical protein